VDLIVTELAVIEPGPHGLTLKELAPGVSIEAVLQLTGTQLIVPEHVPVMRLIQPNCA
jgi:acetate CoA/acetoacetate CoA-transferase beta subunit